MKNRFLSRILVSFIFFCCCFDISFATNISGTITQNDTLTLSESPYVLSGDLTIPDSVTLTIEPGVSIEFPGYSYDILVNGTLIAVGTPSDTISFYSNSTAYGGGSIVLEDGSSGHHLQYCSFNNLGVHSASYYDTGLYIADTNPSVDYCTFTHCGTGGYTHIRTRATALENFGSNNDLYRVYLLNNTLDTTSIWPNIDVGGFEYVITATQTLPFGDTLTIEPGVTIDLSSYNRNLIINGALIAAGTPSDTISFYSSSTDYGGGSIVLGDGSTGHHLQYCSFNNLGIHGSSIYDTGLYVADTNPSVDYCTFTHCGTGGYTHIRTRATALENFGANNDLYRVYLLDNTLDKTSIWPNLDIGGFEYVITDNQNLPFGDTLTIKPGVTIDLSYFNRDLIINGTLIAEGTPSENITFFSSSSSGGGSVVLADGSINHRLQYCTFNKLGIHGSSYYDAGLYVADTNPIVDHCTFTNCGTGGVKHISARATSLDNFGSFNDLFRVYLLDATLDRTSLWPNIDTSGFEYVITANQTLPVGETLIIEPAVTIDLSYYNRSLIINGTLIAEGTSSENITFSSSSSAGGGSVVLADGSIDHRLQYCTFNKLGIHGASIYDTGLYVADTKPLVDYCTFTNCGTGGYSHIRSRATALENFGPNNDLFRAYILNNTLDRTSIWPNIDVGGFEYVLIADQTLPAGDTLTIEPGVDINLSYLDRDLIINGTLIASGLENDPIGFSSSSSAGGGSVVLNNPITTSVISYCSFSKLGIHGNSTYDCALRVQGACQVTNSEFRDNIRGIYITSFVSPIIRLNQIFDNTNGIQISQSDHPNISFNSIENNSSWGLYNGGTNVVDACNNWWGDPTGPYHSVNNPSGLGNQVSNNVLAGDCFLSEPTYVQITPLVLGTSCIGTSDGSINLTIRGGVPPYTFAWSNSSTDSLLTDLIAGTYAVTVYDADSLTAIESYLVEDPPQVTITASGSDTICYGSAILLTANNASTIQWSTSDTTAQITVAPDTTTTYYLSGTYASSCPYSDSITIHVVPYNPPGQITAMIPADSTDNLRLPLNLSWVPVANALYYDLYIWLDSLPRPATPTVAGITDINYTYNGSLFYSLPYKWQIIARNNCFATDGVEQQFTLRELPDAVVYDVIIPTTAFSGQLLSVDWQVKNEGLGQTLAQQWIDAVYLSTDSTLETSVDLYLGGTSNFSALNPQEIYAQSETFTIPNGLDGNYYVIVVTDRFNALLESDDTNNSTTSSAPMLINLTPPPDLQVTNISVLGNTTVFSGTTLDLSYTVSNNGTGGTVATFWRDRIYLSLDTIVNAGDYNLSTINRSAELLENENYSTTKTVTIPNHIFGTYYLLVRTDLNNHVYEYLYENNNVNQSVPLTVTLFPPPDLVPTNMIGPVSANNKEVVTVNWQVENQGASAATTNWLDRVYLSKNPTLIPGEYVEVAYKYQSTDLNISENYSVSRSLIIPPDIGGIYYFILVTDQSNKVAEYAGESNNMLASSPIQIHTPDLTPISFQSPATIVAGQSINLDWSVQNIGVGKLNNTNWEDRLYLSTSPVFDQATAIPATTKNQMSALESGDSLSTQHSFTIPPNLSGSYYWTLWINQDQGVYEHADTLNNIYTDPQPINIQSLDPVDLEIIQLNTPASTLAGISIPIDFTIKNNSSTNIQNSIWVDRIYLSAAPFWMHPDSAILLKNLGQNRTLLSSDTYSEQTSVVLPMLPGGISVNTCYLYAFTDASDNLYEGTNETNNILRSDPITVTAPATDLDVFCFMGEDTLTSGEATTIRWTVENLGDTSVLSNYWFWYDGVYLSEDTLFDAGDQFIFDYPVYNTDVVNNRYGKINQTLNIPNGISGDYYLFMVADHTELSYDIDYSNNATLRTLVDGVILRGNDGLPKPIHFVVPPTADLIIENFDAPQTGLSGQPIEINWSIKNAGNGATTSNGWNDKIYLSTNSTLDNNDVLLGSFATDTTLVPGGSYDATLEVFLPVSATGNYYLIFATDADDTEYEYQGEVNNTLNAVITVVQPLPSDLIVSEVAAPTNATVGNPVNVSWTIRNIGVNPACGYMREAVFFSTDTILDEFDVLIGTLDNTLNLAPLSTEVHNLNVSLPGMVIDDYHVIVQTDLLDNILETNEQNNKGLNETTVSVAIPELPLDVLTPNTLTNYSPIYYRIEIADSLYNETLKIRLEGDSINGSNELFVRFAGIPSRTTYDYAEQAPFFGHQELIVPNLQPGTYYLMVYGANTQGSAQPITLLASILNFEVSAVEANEGGNTGQVTVKVTGAKFEENMAVILDKGSDGIHIATAVYYMNPTTLFATFDLVGATIGLYDLTVRKASGKTATLQDGFTVLEGLPPSMIFSIDHPPNTRLNRIVPMTLQVVNDGNVDIPLIEIYAMSLQGAYLGRTATELDYERQDVPVDLHVPGEPLEVLRPGATVAVPLYTLSNAPMRFQLVEMD